MTALVAGIDGCRAGWAIAVAGPAGRVEVEAAASIEPTLDRVRRGELLAAAVDMPIGLPGATRRECDHLARALLGPRRSSVFPTPARAVLGAVDHLDACERSAAACGRRLSVQAYNLLPRIAELDGLVDPELQQRVVEAHPELAFARLAGQPLAHAKRTSEGRAQRRELLAAASLTVPGQVPAGMAADDLLDAAVLVLVARAVAAGAAEHMGDGACDARGLRMEIVTLPAAGAGAGRD